MDMQFGKNDGSSLNGGSSIAAPGASWIAIVALSIGSFAMVTTEYLPVGLLPQIARSLGVSEGQAGLMVTVPGLVAAVAAPLSIGFAGRFDRRYVLWVLLGLMVASNALVAAAPNFIVALFGRVLFGISLGGYWTIAGTLGSRLRPAQSARATSIIFAGISLGTVAGVPAGALLGSAMGWTMAFTASSVVAVLVLVALVALLPRIPAQSGSAIGAIPTVLRRRRAQVSILITIILLMGQFLAYTYIAPFLNQVSHIESGMLSLVLLGYGVAGFFGNFFGGWVAARDVRTAMVTTAVLVGGSILLLIQVGEIAWAASLSVVLWGFGAGMIPVVSQAFVFRAAPDHLESIAALTVTSFQFAIGAGALIGGVFVDWIGVASVLWFGVAAMLLIVGLVGSKVGKATLADGNATHACADFSG